MQLELITNYKKF